MYKLTGLPVTLACTCMYLANSLDGGGVILEHVTKLSFGLIGVMLIPSVIAKIVYHWRRA